jgi:hypothetical protein
VRGRWQSSHGASPEREARRAAGVQPSWLRAVLASAHRPPASRVHAPAAHQLPRSTSPMQSMRRGVSGRKTSFRLFVIIASGARRSSLSPTTRRRAAPRPLSAA